MEGSSNSGEVALTGAQGAIDPEIPEPETLLMDVDLHDLPDDTIRPQSPILPPPPIQMTSSAQARRSGRVPKRFDDIPPAPAVPVELPAEAEPSRLPRIILIVRDRLITAANRFGLWRDYPRRPSYDPDTLLSLEELAVPVEAGVISGGLDADSKLESVSTFSLFRNKSVELLMGWMNNGYIQKSEEDVNRLVHDVILHEDFNPKDLSGFNANQENRRLDASIAKSGILAGFTSATLTIDVPSGVRGTQPSPFEIPGLHFRKLTSVIREAFTSPYAHHIHFSPFRLYHKPANGSAEERIYNEVYTSDAFLEEHEHLQRHAVVPPEEPDCKLEKVVAAVMLASDATHLTDFGNAKAWPIYLMLGNLSKYFRAQTNLRALHHLAYIPSVRCLLAPTMSVNSCNMIYW